MNQVLCILAGGTISVGAVLTDVIVGIPQNWGFLQTLLLGAGLLLVLLGFLPAAWRLDRITTPISLILITFFIALGIGEVVCRIFNMDFAQEERHWRLTPLYYRQPVVPTGEIYFRRAGPEVWTGPVISARLRQIKGNPNAYAGEASITVQYDQNGFRNPLDLADWDIAVAGDSFVELGYLPDRQLFTSVLAETLNVKVKNLGVSNTGPLSYLHYLERYGIASGTKQVMAAFFEGNDLTDLSDEYEALARWQKNGQRDFREFKRKSSLTRVLYLWFCRIKTGPSPENDFINADFQSDGKKVPITLTETPPAAVDLTDDTMTQLADFFSRLADLEKRRSVTVWVAYLPCKRRVLDGMVEFRDNAPAALRAWQPTDLPELFKQLATQFGVHFVDLTPVLVSETRQTGKLLYNAVFDTHLNAAGAQVVGKALSRALADDAPTSSPDEIRR